MNILGFNLDYRRVIFYKEIEPDKKKSQEMYDKAISSSKKVKAAFLGKGLDVQEVKFRNWWYAWWSVYPAYFFIFPILFIPYWQKKKRNAFSKMKNFLENGYEVSDDVISQNIVVQMAGLPLHSVKGTIKRTKGLDFDEIRKKYWGSYRRGKMSKTEMKKFEKEVELFFKEHSFMLNTRAGKRISKMKISKKGSKR